MSSDKLCDRREGLLLLSANPKFCAEVKFPVLTNRVVTDSIYQELPSEEGKGVALDVVEQATMPDPFEWTLGVQPGCPKATMDPEIKLFGQTIGVASSRADAGADAGVLKPTSASPPWNTAPSSKQDGGDSSLLRNENEGGVVEKLRTARSSSRDEFLQPPKSTELVPGNRSTMVFSLGASDSEGAHSDELKDQGEGDHSQYLGDDKHLQKPDKVVSCPRCDSLDTKFCYYNNYNINQPRHFCKNCQRYWTAGGTLRNVPVGAGRRKNKHGVVQRDCTEASVNCPIQSDSGDSASQLFPCAIGSPTSQKAASSLKHPQPKRLAGQGSPMRSPRSTMSFGQDNGITLPSSFSLHRNGPIPFQPFSSSQGFLTSGSEVYTVGSSDSSSVTIGQRIARFPAGNGIDKDCSRSSLSGQLQDNHILRSMPTVYNPPLQLESSSGMHRSVLPPGSSGWAGNGAPAGLHSGEWPHNHHLELDGKHSTQAVRTTYNTATTLPAISSWSPANVQWGATQWGADVGHLSNPAQMPTQVWPCGQPMAQNVTSLEHSDVAVSTTLGKRGLSDEGSSMWPSKVLRPHDSRSLNSWSMFGKNQSEVSSSGNALNLFRPKVEVAVACETKDSFVSRHFTTVAAARPVPFQVTI